MKATNNAQWNLEWKSSIINYAFGIPKGLRIVLEKKETDIRQMNAEKMDEVLSSHLTSSMKNKYRKVSF